MKARIPSHREFIINFPDSVDQAKANEGWAKLQQIVEDYKKAHNGASVYALHLHRGLRACRQEAAGRVRLRVRCRVREVIFPEDSTK